MFHRFLIWLMYAVGLDPRGIFVFYDGRRYRRGDPIRMARQIWSINGFDAEECRKRIGTSASGLEKIDAYAEIGSAVRAAWQLDQVHHGGLTDVECDQLLARFEAYLGDLKKNGSPGQTPPQFTVPDVSHIPVTVVSSDCGSTSIDSI